MWILRPNVTLKTCGLVLVGRRCSSVNPLLATGEEKKQWMDLLLYGATDIKGASGVEYVPLWPNVCVVPVLQIVNRLAPGLLGLGNWFWRKNGLFVRWPEIDCLLLFLFLCSLPLLSDPGNAGSPCTLGPHYTDLHTTAVSIEMISMLWISEQYIFQPLHTDERCSPLQNIIIHF